MNSCQSSSWKIRSSLRDPVVIFWDIENCAVPSDMSLEDVTCNIMTCLRAHPTINGPVKMFSAYGDSRALSRRLEKGVHRTGVRLIHVPNDAASEKISFDMFLFALDNRPPSSIMLISGDRYFARALHILGQRGYTIILVIPSRVGVSSALSNASHFIWDWSSVARGHGFVPQANANVAWFPVKCSMNESIDNSKGYYSMSNFNINSCQSSSWKIQSFLQVPIAIFWDIESCVVPSDVCPEDVAGNIRMSSQSHPTINGPVTMFSAYGDFSVFPRRLRKGCQRIGVKLVGVPYDTTYKKILADMFSFALDNRPPSTILLISGERDFAPTLNVLGERGYTIILVIPSRVGVSSALTNASRFLWDWSNVARGHGFVPQARANVAWFPVMSDSTFECNDNLVSESMTSTSQTFTCTLDKVSAGALASSDQNDLAQVQRRDLNVLRGQLVKLLELSGGCLPLIRLPVVYHKMYGKSLCVFKYGTSKLSRLLKKMDDLMTVQGKHRDKVVFLCNSRS